MRIALCFCGIVGGVKGKDGKGVDIDPAIGAESWQKHFIKQNDNVDVFFHTWSVEHKEQLLKLYQPKKHIVETQKDFPNIKKSSPSWRAHSRWYSSQKAIQLKKKYETENNFVYDAVIISRFDMLWFRNVNLKAYDLKYWYASHWNDSSTKKTKYRANRNNYFVGRGFMDLWFFSNSQNMDKFGKLYDTISKYKESPHISSYQHVARCIGRRKIRYTMFRWFDYEIARRKVFATNE